MTSRLPALRLFTFDVPVQVPFVGIVLSFPKKKTVDIKRKQNGLIGGALQSAPIPQHMGPYMRQNKTQKAVISLPPAFLFLGRRPTTNLSSTVESISTRTRHH